MTQANDGLLDIMLQAEALSAEQHPRVEGDYVDKEDGLLHCGKCKGKKQVEVKLGFTDPPTISRPYVPCPCEEEAQRELEAEKRYKERLERDMQALQKLRKESLMDEKFMHSTFDAFTETEDNATIRRACIRYVNAFAEMEQKNVGLLFYGDTGTGKTFAAACIANALLEKRIPIMMTSFIKLMSTDKFGDADEEVIERLSHARLLILDDFGAEHGSDFALERVYNIVDSRYRAAKPIIVTTNLSREELVHPQDMRYKRIFDRVMEMCGGQIRFKGTSWRKKQSFQRYEQTMKFLLEDENHG